jgi:hypothetical protein
MNRASLQALTWGTVAAAVASAMLLAAAGDDEDLWQLGNGGNAPGRGDRAAPRPAVVPGMAAPGERDAPRGTGRP